MRLHLIQGHSVFGPPERQEELKTCWARNEGLFDEYTFPEGRPTFSELFTLCKPDMVNVIMNADIYMSSEGAAILANHDHGPNENECFALSRWNVKPDGSTVLWDHRDSADTWVIYGAANPIDVPWSMGTAGVDNRLAWVLQQAGYTLINPSKTIRTFHLHNVAWRSYLNDPSGVARGGDKIFRIPPPYAFAQPTEL